MSSTTKTLLSGAPSQGQGGSTHSPHIHTQAKVPQHHQAQHVLPELNTQSFPFFPSLSLHSCLFRPLWGVCLSTEHGDCSIAEKMYKTLSLLFCWAFSICSRIVELYRKPLCWALKMSSWIWSSCIQLQVRTGTHTLKIRIIYKHMQPERNFTCRTECWGIIFYDCVHFTSPCFLTLLHHNLSA